MRTTQPRTSAAFFQSMPQMSCAHGSSSTSGWVSVHKSSACIELKSLQNSDAFQPCSVVQHPYPTEDEKKQIATQTNLTLLQVNNWWVALYPKTIYSHVCDRRQFSTNCCSIIGQPGNCAGLPAVSWGFLLCSSRFTFHWWNSDLFP